MFSELEPALTPAAVLGEKTISISRNDRKPVGAPARRRARLYALHPNRHPDGACAGACGCVEVQLEPDPALLQEIAGTDPGNALLTPAYTRAQQLDGHQPVAILADRGREPRGCVGYLKQRQFERVLDIESIPELGADHPIWAAILGFCNRHRVTQLRINSFGSSGARVPALASEISRRERREFVLDLDRPLRLSTNHRRNVRNGEQYGLQVIERTDAAGAELHAALIRQSEERRRERGEQIYGGTSLNGFRRLLESGAAVVFQAVGPDGTTVSSIMTVIGPHSAYYHSAGTSPEGMSEGAAQFLVANVAERLAERGVATFNLGGASETQQGLARFKRSFGAREVVLEAAVFEVSSGLSRVWLGLARRLPARVGKTLSRLF